MNPNFAGFLAILLWSLLALLTAASGSVPPFQLLAMTFAIGTLVGLLRRLASRPQEEKTPFNPVATAIGIAGLFGYHFLYYTALRNAPVAEASLIAYLWPLLIVLGSALLPGEKLRWFHVAGGLLGFAGAALLLAGRIDTDVSASGSALGYAAAFACAFVWSGYSILSRKFPKVPTSMVTLYCAATAALSLSCHLLLEETIWPQGAWQWAAVVGLGLGPVGLAFYVWDHGMKRGNIQLLGTAAYSAPVLSTLVLVATGLAEPTASLFIACLLVTLGALIASGRLRI